MPKGYLIFNSMESKVLISKPLTSINTHKGKILLSDNISYGQRVYTTKGKFYFIVKPTYKDIILKIDRTTNTFNPKDIGHILVNTSINKYSKVLEIGCGSGAFSLFLSHFLINPIISIDINYKNLKNALNNITKYGDNSCFSPILVNIYNLPFKIKEYFDAIIIDISEPYIYLDFILNTLKPGGDLVFLLPNIEQVKESRKIFASNGFVYFRTYEIIEREWVVREVGSRPSEKNIGHSMFLTFAKKISNP